MKAAKKNTRLICVIGIIVPIAFATVVLSFKTSNTSKKDNSSVSEIKENNSNLQWDIRALDSATAMLQDGYLVMRAGNDVTGYLLSQFNQADKTYSHCGLVLVENGYPFVYHCAGSEQHPDAAMRRDSACIFFSPANNLIIGAAAYDLSPKQVAALKKTVRQYYKEGKKFDPHFDLQTDDRFYCSEFVYKALLCASGDSNYIIPGVSGSFKFVGIDHLYRNSHATPVWQVKYK